MKSRLIIWDVLTAVPKNGKKPLNFQTSSFVKPEFDEAHFNLATTYLAKNDRDSAIETYSILKVLNTNLAIITPNLFRDRIIPAND